MAHNLLSLRQSSSQTVPALPTDTIRPSPPPSPTKISPAEFDYLNLQANTIRVYGGSEEDIVDFTRNHVGLSPKKRRKALVEGITETGGGSVDPSLVLGLPAKLYQGFSFGFGDEFVGTMMGLVSPAFGAQEGRDLYREILQAGTGNKVVDVLLELAGTVATGTVAIKALGIGAGVGAQALAGGGGGAVSGFANATGEITDRAKSTLIGGGLGLGVGLGVSAVVGAATPLLRAPARAALDKLKSMDTVQRLIPGIGTSDDHARRVILDVLESTTPKTEVTAINQLRDRVSALRAQGISPTLADAGDDTMLALMGETFNFRTPASQETFELIMERQAGQGARLSEDLFSSVFDGIKFGSDNAYSAVDKISTTMSRLSAPLYEESHRLLMPVSPRMKQLILGNPALRASYEIGERLGKSMDLTIAGQEATAAGRLTIPKLPSGSLLEAAEQKLLDFDLSPERIQAMLAEIPDDFPTEIPIRAIDFMQQGLRSVKERLLRSPKGLDFKEFQALNDTLEEILGEAERAAPIFGEARATWAGYSAARDAVEMGRGFSGKAPEIIQKEISKLSARHPVNGDFYRLGVMQDIAETVKGDISKRESADVAREVFGGRLFREPEDLSMLRIRALFDSDASADDFMRRVVGETRLSRTAEAAGGIKPTSGSSFQQSVQSAEGALPFGRASAVLNAYSVARQAMVTGNMKFRTRVADDMAVMFSRGLDSPQSLDTLIDSFEDFQLRELATKQFKTSAKGGLTITLSSGLANLFAN